MGAAAYRRGSANVRREIEEDFRKRAEENRRLGIFDPVVILQDQHANEMNAANERINALEKELAQKNAEIATLTAQNEALREKSFRFHAERDQWELRWKRSNAVLCVAASYRGREDIDDWHHEAKHDHLELWPDIERDWMGWPVELPRHRRSVP